MNIQLFVSKKGHVAFACHGRFNKEISQIAVNSNTGQITFVFKPDLQIWRPNCKITPELCKKVQNQLFCAIGYYEGKKLVASEYVRFTCLAR